MIPSRRERNLELRINRPLKPLVLVGAGSTSQKIDRRVPVSHVVHVAFARKQSTDLLLVLLAPRQYMSVIQIYNDD